MADDYVKLALSGEDATPAYRHHLRISLKRERTHLRETLQAAGVWFVDIPRTGSSSIRQALSTGLGYPFGKTDSVEKDKLASSLHSMLLPPHTPAFIARKVIGEDVWDGLQTFSVVRHPFDWITSLWRYAMQYGGLVQGQVTFQAFVDHLAQTTAGDIRQRTFVPLSYIQTDYLFCPDTGMRLVPNVFRYEAMDEVHQWLAATTGLNASPDVRRMQTRQDGFDVSGQDLEYARTVLSRDFELLGYV